MLGTEYYDYKVFNLNAATRYSPTDLIPTLNAGAERTKATSSKREPFGFCIRTYQL